MILTPYYRSNRIVRVILISLCTLLTSAAQAETVKDLEALVDELGSKDQFAGAVLIAKGNTVMFKKAAGLASRRFDVPNRIDTKFNIGSMNKMFTAVAVLQLVEQKQLSLNDPLSKFVGPDWLPSKLANQIQIQHLLCHTSGLGDYFTDEFWKASRREYRNLEDFKPLVVTKELAFKPGSKQEYSNTGMHLLGVVIEKVSGQDYHDYVHEHVYTPAGMTNSGCFAMDKPVPNLAIGYYHEEGENDQWTNNLFMHTLRGGPAGGGFSTVEDLFRFSRALVEHKLLNKKHTKMLVTPKPNSPSYGFGFELENSPIGQIVGHSGGFPGVHAKLEIVESGYTIVVLSNMDGAGIPVVRMLHTIVATNQ